MAKHLLRLSDFSREELLAYIDRGIALKKETAAGIRHTQLAGRTVRAASSSSSE